MSDKELAIIGGKDTATGIQVSTADKDTIVYDTPECCLWYVEDLPDKYKGKPVSMWTEHTVYRENIQVINVFVSKYENMLAYPQKGKVEALKTTQRKATYLVEALDKRLDDAICIVEKDNGNASYAIR